MDHAETRSRIALQGVVAAYRRMIVPLTIALTVALVLRVVLITIDALRIPGSFGIDFQAVTDAARRWISGGSPYLARQLAGPYVQIGWNPADHGEYLYPPVTLPILVFFAYVPAAWWIGWGILFTGGLARLRPASWAWPLLLLLATTSALVPVLVAGNPVIWILLGTLFARITGWSGALVLLKPTLAPFALLGIERRSWWIACGVIAIACVPFLGLWVDWYHAVTNIEGVNITYSFAQIPMMLIPVVAIWASTVPGMRPELPSRLRRWPGWAALGSGSGEPAPGDGTR